MRRSLLLAVLLGLLAIAAHADRYGSQSPSPECPVCDCSTCVSAPTQAGSDAGTSLSVSEGDLGESLDLSGTFSSTGPTLQFKVRYDSYNADTSHAQLDTTM